MFRFNKPSSESLLLCFAKVIIIKTVSSKRRYESVRSCGCVFIRPVMENFPSPLETRKIRSRTDSLTAFLTNCFNNYNFSKAQQ